MKTFAKTIVVGLTMPALFAAHADLGNAGAERQVACAAGNATACSVAAMAIPLPDDPADHRGILSWFSQKRSEKENRLHDAGSYGYLVEAAMPAEVVAASGNGTVVVRLEAVDTGLAVYGPSFGRMPFGPHLMPVDADAPAATAHAP